VGDGVGVRVSHDAGDPAGSRGARDPAGAAEEAGAAVTVRVPDGAAARGVAGVVHAVAASISRTYQRMPFPLIR
jgi:hypothetical protein